MNNNGSETISFNDFSKVKLQVGKIISAENLQGYNKILKILVNMGDKEIEIMSGIARYYDPNELQGKLVIVCTNLEPKKFGDNISNGMILATEKDGKPVLLTVSEEVEAGSLVS